MNVSELKEKIATHANMLLLDIREADEFANGSIEGAENMPMGKVFVEAAQGNLPKDTTIVIMCATGGRCQIVARELGQKGYDIEILEGGLAAWQASEQEE